jgi:hypothetical protein
MPLRQGRQQPGRAQGAAPEQRGALRAPRMGALRLGEAHSYEAQDSQHAADNGELHARGCIVPPAALERIQASQGAASAMPSCHG